MKARKYKVPANIETKVCGLGWQVDRFLQNNYNCCSLVLACRLLFAGCWWLLVVCCLLIVAYCLLLVALLFVAC